MVGLHAGLQFQRRDEVALIGDFLPHAREEERAKAHVLDDHAVDAAPGAASTGGRLASVITCGGKPVSSPNKIERRARSISIGPIASIFALSSSTAPRS